MKDESFSVWVDLVDKDNVRREVEARCIAELPLEIFVPNSIKGYKENPPIYSGIYKLGVEVRSTRNITISYYRRYLNVKENVFSLNINRNIECVQQEIQEFMKYLEDNKIEVFNTERFMKIFANFVKNGLDYKKIEGEVYSAEGKSDTLQQDVEEIKNRKR